MGKVANIKEQIQNEDYCRICLNEKHNINLQREDCKYDYYMLPCICCGEVRNIVRAISLKGRLRILFGKKH